MAKPPLIKTPKKAISVVMDNWTEEKEFILQTIIKNLWKLKRRQKIGFDFGTKKEFELKRIK